MRPSKKIIISLCSFALFAGVMNADENAGSWEPLQVSVQREPIDTAVPIMSAIVSIHSEKLTFMIPENFRLGGDPAHGRLQMENLDANLLITFTILGPVPTDSPTLDAGAYRAMFSGRHPGGKIVDEFQGRAGCGQTGPGFDLEWNGVGGIAERTRAVYLPTVAGVLEMTITSGAQNFS